MAWLKRTLSSLKLPRRRHLVLRQKRPRSHSERRQTCGPGVRTNRWRMQREWAGWGLSQGLALVQIGDACTEELEASLSSASAWDYLE